MLPILLFGGYANASRSMDDEPGFLRMPVMRDLCFFLRIFPVSRAESTLVPSFGPVFESMPRSYRLDGLRSSASN